MEYDRWDIMVLEYRNSNSEKERNKIYTELRQIYLPKLYTIIKDYPHKYRNDMKSLYDILFLKAIDKWRGDNSCHFSSYVYMWVTTKLKSEIYEKFIKIDDRYLSLDNYERGNYGENT